MNFLSSVRSVTKEDPYVILVRSPLTMKTRTFKVKGHLSINAEREINNFGDVFQEQSYQFISDVKIEDKLKKREREERADFYLIDPRGNEVRLVLVNDYASKGYLLGVFNNYVYKGKITYANH